MEAFGVVALVSLFLFINDYESDSGYISSPTDPVFIISPNPEFGKTEGALISYQFGYNGTWKPWVKTLNNFLADYVEGSQFDTGELRKVCDAETNYGYEQGQPCIIIHLGKIPDWVPVPYNSSSLPSDMPRDLQKRVKKFPLEGRMIWISCGGVTAADHENLGVIKYWPFQGIPTYYFPFTYHSNYLPPIVAVRFLNPKINVLINIECRAWAENIVYSRQEGSGSVNFTLLIE